MIYTFYFLLFIRLNIILNIILNTIIMNIITIIYYVFVQFKSFQHFFFRKYLFI